jgi:hypothetical protein
MQTPIWITLLDYTGWSHPYENPVLQKCHNSLLEITRTNKKEARERHNKKILEYCPSILNIVIIKNANNLA